MLQINGLTLFFFATGFFCSSAGEESSGAEVGGAWDAGGGAFAAALGGADVPPLALAA